MELSQMNEVANTIKNETNKGANTAQRVGGLLVNIVTKLTELFSKKVSADDIADSAITAAKLSATEYTATPHWSNTLLLVKDGKLYTMKIDQIAKGMGDHTLEGKVIATKTIGNSNIGDYSIDARTLANACVTKSKLSSEVLAMFSGSGTGSSGGTGGTTTATAAEIDINELDTITSIGQADFVYNVTQTVNGDKVSVGKMLVFSDGSKHVITQVFFGHFDYSLAPCSNSHTHSVGVIWRSYAFSNSAHDIPARTWGQWHDCVTDTMTIFADYYDGELASIKQRLAALEA